MPQDTGEVPGDPRVEDADMCEVLRELSGACNWDHRVHCRVQACVVAVFGFGYPDVD